MKRLFLIMTTAAVLGLVPAMADQNTFSKPGSISAQVGIGVSWAYLGGLNIEGGADLGLVQVPFAPKLPIDFGVAGRVGFGTWGALSVGAFGTASYSWKSLGLGVEWVNQLESYLALGLVFIPGLGLDAFAGNAYHFDKNLAVFLESGYHTNVLGVSFGL